jgi:DNA (cytosine-5)-methyltransferase 1
MVNLKVLNLYAGIGGNRKLWTGVDVTAVEWDPKIAAVYQDFFPDDKVVVGDAHQYLLDYHKEFDFIWSSPPCPTHSNMNYTLYAQGHRRYPDMKLYEEIIYLEHFYKGLYCVENVMGYYDPLIKPQILDRHYFWSNFYITEYPEIKRSFNLVNGRGSTRVHNSVYPGLLEEFLGIHLSDVGTTFKIKVLTNCVHPKVGDHILSCARGNTQQTLI